MYTPENLEAPNSSETQGGTASTPSPATQRALGRTALGATALGSAGQKTPEALERAANQLDVVARQLTQVSQSTQTYQSKVHPIAQGVEQVVGGSATGMDKQISGLLNGFARDVSRSAGASHHAAEVARKLAAQARAEAQQIRRQQEAERQSRQQGQRR